MQVTIVLKTNLGTILENGFENKTSLRVTKSNHFVYNIIYTNNWHYVPQKTKESLVSMQ
jgi:hypothetical protein